VFPRTIGVAAGSRIGPESSAVTVLGRPQKQDRERTSVPGPATRELSTIRRTCRELWITRPDILVPDGVRDSGTHYDRGQVAAQLTSGSPPRFAHESEAELARILDFYGVEWRYEPDVFPISWNADGAVVESFAPDFYL